MEFYTLDEYVEQVGSISSRFERAKHTVKISGNDCKAVVESNSSHLEKMLKRNVKVQIMCVDPYSTGALQLPLIDPRFDKIEDFRESMKSVMKVLDKFSAKYPNNFEYGLLPISPSIGLFFIDPYREDYSLSKLEIYVAKEFAPKDSRPHLIFNDEDWGWKRFYLNQWGNYWDLCKLDNPDLSYINQLPNTIGRIHDGEKEIKSILKSIKGEIPRWRKMISHNQNKSTLYEIIDFLNKTSLNQWRNIATINLAEYNEIEMDKSNGLMSTNESRLRRTLNTFTLLNLIDSIESVIN